MRLFMDAVQTLPIEVGAIWSSLLLREQHEWQILASANVPFTQFICNMVLTKCQWDGMAIHI